jgi:hypothetical protein
MHPRSLAAQVNKLGVPTSTARTAAIRQHVSEMSVPVIADALGYHPVTTAQDHRPRPIRAINSTTEKNGSMINRPPICRPART